MKHMFQQALDQPALLIWPAFGTLICFGIMFGAFLWAYRPKAKAFYKEMALSVFDDQERSNHGA